MHKQQPDPPGLALVVSRREALDAGLTSDQIRQRVRSGRWVVLGPGGYLRCSLDSPDPFAAARELHALEALAAARRISGATVAYGSAALVHGMGLASGVPAQHELLVPPGSWNGVRRGLRIRLAELLPDDVITVGGVPVTTPARSWVDIARTSPLADALSAGDSALRLGRASIDEISAVLARHTSTRGKNRAGLALPLLSPLRENPLESRAFASFVEWGLPLPECQVSIWDRYGFIGRVDFLWRWARLIAEADGRLKYTSEEALYAEKLREDRLREDEYGVIRFGWRGIDERLRRRLEHLLSRAA